jgi:hypothetical protein
MRKGIGRNQSNCQVERWKYNSKEYQIAAEKSDIVKQAGMLNAWEAMAREIIYDCMINI